MPLLLTEADVRSVLPMDDLIGAMEQALAQLARGEVQQPLRSVLTFGEDRSYFGVMPAATANPPTVGAKLVTLVHANAACGLPTHLATIVLFDPSTGALEAILDGRLITEARTAAVSAVATRHLARASASALAILGSGVQARSHADAIPRVRPVGQIRVWSPTAAHRSRFVDEVGPGAAAPIRAVDSAEEAVRGADLVVLATSAAAPVVRDEWVADGAHVVSVGACRPDQREMDPALVARARLFVDSRAGALTESGDVVMGIAEGRFGPDHLAGELGDVVLGRLRGRTRDDEVTIFKSLGMAVEDVAAAQLALDRARERGIGRALLI